ncbi:MAG: hypothetical protein NZ611_04755 [Bacteroidia bacterium]|nr:hypothetical protein [Bacteroidia bacterium]
MKRLISVTVWTLSWAFGQTTESVPIAFSSQGVFRENKGQVYDQYRHPRSDILYSGQTEGFSYHLTATGIHYQLSQIEEWKTPTPEEAQLLQYVLPHPREVEKLEMPQTISIWRIDIDFVGASPAVRIEAEEPISGHENFYNVPGDPVLYVKTYRRVRYKGLWPGVDAVFYGEKGQLKYDFYVQPGVEASVIKLHVRGAEVRVENNEVVLLTPKGEIREGLPEAWVGDRKVAAFWKVEGGRTLTFSVPERQLHEPLRIDPLVRTAVRVWGTYLPLAVSDMDIDGNGNTYCSGWLLAEVPQLATAGAHQTTWGGGGTDAAIMSFDPNGNRRWGTYYGGEGSEAAMECVVDYTTNSFVYMAGVTVDSYTGIATPGAHQTVLRGTNDFFIVKFNTTNGTREWGTYFGGSADDTFRGVSPYFVGGTTIDANGNLYFGAFTRSTDFIATPGSARPNYNGGPWDGFVAKFAPNGTLLWGTYFGGPDVDVVSCVAFRSVNGYIYIAGTTLSTTGIATIGYGHQGMEDGFIAYLPPTGSTITWARYYGGQYNERVVDCYSFMGPLFAVGWTGSSTNIATPGTYQPNISPPDLLHESSADAFAARFNRVGDLVWGSYYGGGGDINNVELGLVEYFSACHVISRGAEWVLYVAGFTDYDDVNFRVTSPCAHKNSRTFPMQRHTEEALVVSFDAITGQRYWGTYYVVSSAGAGIVGSGEYVYIAGPATAISIGAATPGAFMETLTNINILAQAGYLAKFHDVLNCNPLFYQEDERAEAEEPNEEKAWMIYPTITTGAVELWSAEEQWLECADGQGRVVRSWKLSAGERRTEDLSGLPAGIYLVRDCMGHQVKRLILQP